MKNIYKKIILALSIGFFIQIFTMGIFYKHIVPNKIMEESNFQEIRRKHIMKNIIYDIEKTNNNLDAIKVILDESVKKYNANFILKDKEKNVICYSNLKNEYHKCASEETDFKWNEKTIYSLQGYFLLDRNDSIFKIKRQIGKLISFIIMIITSIVVIIIIYKTIANPLKKLSKAVNSIDYGNTLMEIPYYSDDEIGVLCRSLEEMGKRLKKSENNQQELIEAVSHDIKTPLTSILGYSKRLLEGKVKDDKVKDYYAIIYKRANDLKYLLQEFEEYANIKSEDVYNKEILNCKISFEKLCLDIKSEVDSKGCKFSYHNLINPTLVCNCDKKKIKRLFCNLIQNSLKYAGEKCILEVNGSTYNNVLKFEVKDNGKGVPEDQLNKIFDRFYRVESSRSRENGGTGLGLSICKDIVESHGGNISAKNLIEGGFVITMIFDFKNIYS